MEEYIIIGNLDTNKFREISKNIVTNNVIITYKQIEHINQRRNGIYDKYKNDLLDIITNPDYIFKDMHKDTALIIKKAERNIGLVLRLATDSNLGYKNSILTMWEIGEKRLDEYLRNVKIIYKKE